MFEYVRTIGEICGKTGFELITKGTESFLIASVENVFSIYSADSLTKKLESSPMKNVKKIDHLCSSHDDHHIIVVASNNLLIGFDRVEKLWVCSYHESCVKSLIAIGNYCISVDSLNRLLLIEMTTGKISADFTIDSEYFQSDIIFHPNAYLNKIIITSSVPNSSDSSLLLLEPQSYSFELWNFKSEKKVFKFQGWTSQITTIEQTPVIDVAAFGLADGRVMIFNIKTNTLISSYDHTNAIVTSISFSTYQPQTNSAKMFSHKMITSTDKGDLVVWNLETRERGFVYRHAHKGKISKAAFLRDEPILITAGEDNCLKQFIFDSDNDFVPRLLKLRDGHRVGPRKIRFYGRNISDTYNLTNIGMTVLSAGRDCTFRKFNLFIESQNVEMSQKLIVKSAKDFGYSEDHDLKLTEIVDFDFNEIRQRDWSNVVTIHKDDGAAYTWKSEDNAINSFVLRPDQGHSLNPLKTVVAGNLRDELYNRSSNLARRFGAPTSTCMSNCGNFVLVGTSKGLIFKYTIQSGRLVGTFPSKLYFKPVQNSSDASKRDTLDPSDIRNLEELKDDMNLDDICSDKYTDELLQSKYGSHIHTSSVKGVRMDQLGDFLISGGLDGTIHWWNFKTGNHFFFLEIGSPVLQLEFHVDLALLLVICADFKLFVVDSQLRKVVRSFNLPSKVSDGVFSFCGRFIYLGCVDGSIYVYDIVSAKVSSLLQLASPCLSLSITISGQYLLVAERNCIGIKLFRNKFFGHEIKIPQLNLDSCKLFNLEAKDEVIPEVSVDESSLEDVVLKLKRLETLNVSKIRLSTDQKWSNLANLDTIKTRNKPTQSVEKPKAAPFFLPATDNSVVAKIFNSKSSEETKTKLAFEENQALGGFEEDEPFEDNDSISTTEGAKIAARNLKFQSTSNFINELKAGNENYILNLSASGIDYELQTLCLGKEDTKGVENLHVLLLWIRDNLKKNHHFDMINAVLHRILVLHKDVLEEDAVLFDIKLEISQNWKHLSSLISENLCLTSFLTFQN